MNDFDIDIAEINKNIALANENLGKSESDIDNTPKRIINGNKYELDKFKRSVSLINYRRNNKKHNLGKKIEINITTDQNEFEDKMAKITKLVMSKNK